VGNLYSTRVRIARLAYKPEYLLRFFAASAPPSTQQAASLLNAGSGAIYSLLDAQWIVDVSEEALAAALSGKNQ
jgi:hypothetical protein